MLDTHTWVWLFSAPDRLSRRALDAVESADLVFVPAIACWELALLTARGRVAVSIPLPRWFDEAFADPRFRLAPLTPAIAIRAAELDWKHRDPADRLIVATAIELGAPLLTRDERIQSSALTGLVPIW